MIRDKPVHVAIDAQCSAFNDIRRVWRPARFLLGDAGDEEELCAEWTFLVGFRACKGSLSVLSTTTSSRVSGHFMAHPFSNRPAAIAFKRDDWTISDSLASIHNAIPVARIRLFNQGRHHRSITRFSSYICQLVEIADEPFRVP